MKPKNMGVPNEEALFCVTVEFDAVILYFYLIRASILAFFRRQHSTRFEKRTHGDEFRLTDGFQLLLATNFAVVFMKLKNKVVSLLFADLVLVCNGSLFLLSLPCS